MGGQVGDLADEIQAEESGIAEDAEEEIDIDSEEVFDIEGDDEVDATLRYRSQLIRRSRRCSCKN